MARTYGSLTACSERVASFTTSDGGKSWHQSAPIALNAAAGSAATLQPSFIDAHTGWLWIGIGPVGPGRAGPPVVLSITGGTLYGTSDGGLHWQLISNVDLSKITGVAPSNGCPRVDSLTFVSPTDGWMTNLCDGGPLLSTHDGGRTWQAQRLPGPVSALQFFDPMSGVAQVNGANGKLVLYSTSDGGSAWHALPPLPEIGSLLLIDLADANNFWDVAELPGWNKFAPSICITALTGA